MEIIKQVENKLLKRLEIECVFENNSSTLKREEVLKQISKKLKVDENLVIVNHIGNYFGSSQVRVKAKVYEDLNAKDKYARPHMIKRNSFEKSKDEEKQEASA